MRKLGLTWALVAMTVGMIAAGTPPKANAVIHEIVAAYCSGGGVGAIGDAGDLEPPGLQFGAQAFARPVLASGAVDLATLTVTDKPNVKFEEGSSVFALNSSNATHPSAEHCAKNGLP